MKLYFDLETSGLKGDVHLMQYSIDRGEIKIIRPYMPDYLEDLTELCTLLNRKDTVVIGYNIGFDLWKLYQFFSQDCERKKQGILQNNPEKIKRFPCSCKDLYLHAVRGKPLCYFPVVGGKHMVSLKKIPLKYSEKLEEKITKKIEEFLPSNLSVGVSRKEEKDTPGTETLIFFLKGDNKLKSIVPLFRKNYNPILYKDVFKLPKDAGFKEDLRFPFVQKDEEKNYQGLFKINEKVLDDLKSPAYTYARNDIEYLWELEDYLESWGNDLQETENDVATHIVAYTRYHGFTIDVEKSKKVYTKFENRLNEIREKLQINMQSFPQRKLLIEQNMIDFQEDMKPEIISTNSQSLKTLKECGFMSEKGVEIVDLMLEFNPLAQRRKQLETFIGSEDGRFYPNFRVSATTTNRMAGTDKFNTQGVAKDSELRELVYASMGGDFDGQEWRIAATTFQDAQMLEGVRVGEDSHTMTVSLMIPPFEGRSYEELMKIRRNENHPEHEDFQKARAKAKRINFGLLYFATAFAVAETLEIMPQEAEEKMQKKFFSKYRSMGDTRDRFYEDFCTADFENWTQDSVGKMGDFVDNIFGQRRYICFERLLAKFFWEGTDEIARVAKGDSGTVIRMKRDDTGNLKAQTHRQAIRSACLGAASAIQKGVFRQLGNYPIQSAGAKITKELMRDVWNNHGIAMMNIHDEIIIPTGYESIYEEVRKTVEQSISRLCKVVPYLTMEFKKIKTWKEK